MKKFTTLDNLQTGQRAVIKKIYANDDIRRRFLDIGLIKGTVVECVLKSPLGDPSAFMIRGALIALRCDDTSGIETEII